MFYHTDFKDKKKIEAHNDTNHKLLYGLFSWWDKDRKQMISREKDMKNGVEIVDCLVH